MSWIVSRPRLLECGTPVKLVVGLTFFSLLMLFLSPRIPLGAGYHDFADKRPLLGIPNCLDVLSNIPIFVAGVLGVSWLLSSSAGHSFRTQIERLPYLIFFVGVALNGMGSLWYHIVPGNSRLPCDLLPMTLSFTSMVVAVLMERISLKAGLLIYGPVLAFGIASVIYWYVTETLGRGDYRFYLSCSFSLQSCFR